MTTEWLHGLLDVLDPDHQPGRITLIHRMGADHVESKLPPLVEAVRAAGRTVLWVCDPMHGNTETTPQGIKTRRFDKIVNELEQSFELHTRLGSRLGGVHFELTGEDVTECTGGARGLDEAGLERAYKSQVDPRLNYDQALPEMRDADRAASAGPVDVTTRAAVGFVGKRGLTSRLIASWFIPTTLTFAYVLLALTSETDASGWIWMGAGLVLAHGALADVPIAHAGRGAVACDRGGRRRSRARARRRRGRTSARCRPRAVTSCIAASRSSSAVTGPRRCVRSMPPHSPAMRRRVPRSSPRRSGSVR